MSKIKRDLLSLTSSSIFNRGFGLAYVILIRRLLDPPLIGIWNLVEVLKSYLSAITLGVSYSAERVIPYYRGKGEDRNENDTRSFLFTYTFLEGIVISGCLIIYLLFWGESLKQEVLIGLYFLPFLLIVHKLLNCYLLSLRTLKAFQYYSFTNSFFSILDWSLLAYAYFLSLFGVFLGSVINGIIKLLYFYWIVSRKKLFKIRWNFSFKELREHFSYGIPMSLFKAIFTTLQKVDALFVTFLLGTTALSYYYLGVQITNIMMEMPLALFYVSYPNLMERLGKNNDLNLLHEDSKKYMKVLIYLIIPLIVPAAIFSIDFVIYYVLPKFKPGLEAIKIMILGVIFMGLRHLYLQILMAAEWVFLMIIITLIPTGLFFLSYFLLNGWTTDKLASIAWAMVVSQIFYLIFSFISAYVVTKRNVLTYWKEWGTQLVVLFYWMVVILFINNFFGKAKGISVFQDLGQIALKEAIFLILAFPVILYGMREYLAEVKSFAFGIIRNRKV